MFLKKRKISLIEENEILKEELERVKRKYLTGNKIQEVNNWSRTGYYSNLESLPDYSTKWKNSFFELHQDIAEKYTKGNLSPRFIRIRRESIKYYYSIQDSYQYQPFVVHCYGIIPTDDGPMLCVEDPFGSIISKPLKWISLQEVKPWINRILITYIGIHYENTNYLINQVKTLKYNLYDEI